MCWYGILNLWDGILTSENINISSSEVEYVCGLAHCSPKDKKSIIKNYISINGKTGNSLTFVNLRFIGNHQYGTIFNNSVKSGLIYFQDSHTVIKNFYFLKNEGPLTYMCVGKSSGIFQFCIFDSKFEKGIGFDSTISCTIQYDNIITLEIFGYNSYNCNGINNFNNLNNFNLPNFGIISLFLIIFLILSGFYKTIIKNIKRLKRFK